MVRVIMHGCNGRMGQVITEMIAKEAEMQIVAGVDLSDHIQNSYPVFKSMKDCKVEGFLEGTEDIYYSNRISRLEPVESSRRYMAGLGLGREQAMEDTGYDFDKILIYIDKMADGERFFKETEDVFNHIDRLGGVYECVQKEYSKATAIEYIQKELHLADDEIYAFGDSSNDLDMIKAAGHGVIMGHHDPVLEPYAEYITDTVENDGLYKAMEHYGLI